MMWLKELSPDVWLPQAPRSAEGSAPSIDVGELLRGFADNVRHQVSDEIRRRQGYVDPRAGRVHAPQARG